jgi:outer membrane protein assembly factor BamB
MPAKPNHPNSITRRRFVAAVGGTAAAAIVAPAIATRDKSGLGSRLLGGGDHLYEIEHDWLWPPDRIAWGDTHGLCQDADGNIYVAHTVHASSESGDAVVVFDRDGTFVRSFGAAFRGGAHGLDIREERGQEFLYHCDIGRKLVVKTDLKGEVVWQVGLPAEAEVYSEGKRYVPTNVAFAPDGDIFVGDGYGSSYIHRFTADGAFVKTIATPGSGEGEVSGPHGLWIDDRTDGPSLVVADRNNRRLQYLSLEGEHIGFVTDGIRRPCHFKLRGELMLIPDLESVVTLLDGDNKVVAHLGDGHPSGLRNAPREKFVDGQFVHPHDAIFLENGDILVAEWVPIGRVTLLKKKR